jgi:hypothetical protein
MMLTEDEAKIKWCPASFGNIGKLVRRSVHCEASQCMVWRWGVPVSVEKATGKMVLTTVVEGQPSEPVGYCGLASKPE